MSDVEFQILGPMAVRTNGHPVPLGGPRQQAMLAALLLHPNLVVDRRRLASLVWKEPPEAAFANPRQFLWQLRKVLRDPYDDEPRISGEHGFRLRIRSGELDLAVFEKHVALGQSALASGDPNTAVGCLSDALAQWRGTPLQGATAG